jgi:hypothetical protein
MDAVFFIYTCSIIYLSRLITIERLVDKPINVRKWKIVPVTNDNAATVRKPTPIWHNLGLLQSPVA